MIDPPDNTLEEQLLAEVSARDLIVPDDPELNDVQEMLEAVSEADSEES